MSILRFAVMVVVLVVVSRVSAGDAERGKLVGVWEVVKSSDAPAGSTVEFTKEGKLILISADPKEKKLEATYKLDGKTLTTTRTKNGTVEVNVLTIQSLTDARLTVLNDRGSIDELKRAKSK